LKSGVEPNRQPLRKVDPKQLLEKVAQNFFEKYHKLFGSTFSKGGWN
jgi:hypothetical protein